MRVIVDGRTYEGRAIDLTGADVTAAAVVESVGAADSSIRVDCPAPGEVHEHVRRLPPETFDRRAALAAAARALGHASPARSALDEARSELADLSAPPVDVDAARRRAAETGEKEERLRERVAELRGRLQARREIDADTTAVEAQLNEATSRLAEAETERIASEQALERAETLAREARDRRERRLELEDRVANREREVRRDLAAAVWDRFRAALRSVPGTAAAGSTPGTYDGDRVTAALAVARLAPLDAPVVVDGLGRIDGAKAAASVLEAPVIYIG
jgi:chromosome segregation ATPase